jgi:hypothetical protein
MHKNVFVKVYNFVRVLYLPEAKRLLKWNCHEKGWVPSPPDKDGFLEATVANVAGLEIQNGELDL